MALSKKARTWLIVLSIPVMLLIAAVVALKLYLTPSHLRALVIPRVEESIHRKVSVEDISLSLFPGFGIALEGLKVSNPEGMTFDREEFLSLEELVLDVKLFPLLRNELEIDEITLRGLRLYLEVSKDGVANYSQPSEPAAAEQAPSAPPTEVTPSTWEAQQFGLLVSNLEVIDAGIEYVDNKADRRILIEGYNQRMRAKVGRASGEVFLEGESTIGGLSYGSAKSFLISKMPVNTYQRLTFSPQKQILSLDSVHIGIREIALVLNGSVSDVSSKPVLDLSLRSTRAELAQLLSLVPKEYLKAAQGLESSGRFQFALTVKGETSDSLQPQVKGTFEIADGTIRYTGLPKSITNLNVAGGFEQPASPVSKKLSGRLNIEKLSAAFGSSLVTGKLGIVDFDDPTLSATFNGGMNLAEVKDYYPLEQGTELTGSLNANLVLAGKAKVLTSIKASGNLEFRSVRIKTPKAQKPLRNLNGIIAFNNQLIESKQLSMHLGESDMTMAFTMRNYLAMVMEEAKEAGKPSMLVTLNSRQLRTADLMGEEEKPESAERTPTAKPSKRSRGQAEGTTEVQAGLLPNIDVDANVSIGKLMTEKFDFTNARGSVKIRSGVITLENFSINAFEGTVVTRGTLDARQFDRRPFDLNLEVVGVEAHSILPKFTSFGNNLFGKFSMVTSIKGDLNDTLGLDTKTLNGSGTVQIFDGKLIGYPLTAKLADYTGIGELREVVFKNWSNAYTISEGRIHIKDAKIAAANTDFSLNGSQGFDGSLDYKLLVRLPDAVSNRLKIGGLGGGLIGFLKDKEGRINLNFDVGGTATNPTFGLDTQGAQQAAKQVLEQKAREEAQRLQNELKKKAEEELKKKAEEGLKGLFKRR